MKKLVVLMIFAAASHSLGAEKIWTVEIEADRIEDQIRGGLVGELLGNLNGLPHEFKYIDEPGKVEQYTPSLPEGAWTDDDTDIEWVYVSALQKSNTLFLPPERIRELWRTHINRRIWCANAYARQLMEIGIEPPDTGNFVLNPWSDFNISGQFICEAFGLIAPGMPMTAARMGLHYTHVTIEGEPAQTTQLFTAMIATAFFLKDLDAIVDRGLAAIEPKSEIFKIVTDTRRLCRENPQDWKKTRAAVKAAYTHHKGEMRDRNGYELNTASTVAALLYGRGDFVETLRTAFNFGWDADCDAATCATIAGVMRGKRWMDAQGWNIRDVYRNTSRDKMPDDETITRYGDRLIGVAGKVIASHGGELRTVDGKRMYRIQLEEPENIEPLSRNAVQRSNFEHKMKKQIKQGLVSEKTMDRARAAYIAICLDEAKDLQVKDATMWNRAITSLQDFKGLAQVIFQARTPAGMALKTKAVSAGLHEEIEKK